MTDQRHYSAIRIEGDIAYVQLTRGYEAVVDVADVQLVGLSKWTALIARRSDGSIRCVYARRTIGPITELMHRIITRAKVGELVDHKDCDGLNCRRGNLRIATRAQNNQNARKPITNSSGVKGVSWDARNRRWEVRIRVSGVQRFIGRFSDKSVAQAAYANASASLHGPFGRLE